MNKRLLVLVILGALVACLAASAAATILLPPNPQPRYSAQAVWANEKVHWYGGYAKTAVDAAGHTYADNRQTGYSIYDPTANTWVSSKWDEDPQTPPGMDEGGDGMPTYDEGGWVGTSQSFSYDDDHDGTDELFAHAGYPVWSGKFWRFDPNDNKWTMIGPNVTSWGGHRRGVAAVDKATGIVYVSGPAGAPSPKALQAFDLNTQTWDTTLPDVPVDAQWCVGAVVNGKYYVIGGQQGSADHTTAIWAYTISSKTWSAAPVANLLKGIHHSSISVYNNKIYIFGGRTDTAGTQSLLTDIQVFNPADNSVTKLGDMPIAAQGMAAVIDPSGNVYIGSGTTSIDHYGTSSINTLWWKNNINSLGAWTPIAPDPAYFSYYDWDAGGEILTGRVLDPNGNPMGGALVGIKKTGNATADARYYTVADWSGNFSVKVGPGNWKAAAWRSGYAPSADTSFTMPGEPYTLSDIQITKKACTNIAVGATAYFSNEDPGNVGANAIDGKMDTRWSCQGNTGTDQFYTIDLGAAKDITGVNIYWETARPAAYSVDITTDDPNGTNPAWTTIYSVPRGGGGWQANGDHFVDPIRLDATKSARAVRVHCTIFNAGLGNYSAWEIQVLGTTELPTVATLGDARKLNDGDPIFITKPVTASGGPLGTDFYIEESDRSNGIRVIPAEGVNTVASGYLADVVGTMTTTPEGERAIAATSADGWFFSGTPAPLGMNNKTALGAMATGLLIKPWGKVKSIGDKFFMLDDGSDPNAAGVKVYFDSTIQPEVDSFLSFEGVPSKEAGNPIIIATKIDLTSGSIVGDGWIKAWLLNGLYQVANPNQPDPAWQQANLANDFLTTDGGETAINPLPGMLSNGKKWAATTQAGGSRFGLEDVWAGQNTGQVSTYAFVYLYSPEAYDGWPKSAQLRLGSDDGIRAWVNGELVHVNDTAGRGVEEDKDQVLTTLHQGWNTLLLKINNMDGGYGFCARMMADDGTGTYVPLPGLKFSLYPQE